MTSLNVMPGVNSAGAELLRMREVLSTLEQLLEVHERTTIEQSTQLEDALAERRRAEKNLQLANAQLEQRVELRTAELSQTLAELGRREEEFRNLFEEAPVAYHEIDRDGVVRRVNRAECTLLGRAAADMLGRPVWELVSPEVSATSRKATRRKLDGLQELAPCEREYVHRDGTPIIVEIHENYLRDEAGGIRGIRTALLDVTDRKKAKAKLQQAMETAEAASLAKSEFLANMSHEIRTPMNGVIGMTELALNTDLSAEQREYLTMAKDSADSLLTVINDILDFSKIEAGKLDLQSVPFRLQDTCASMLRTLAVRAHQKGLELVYEISPQVPAAVAGDTARLRQVLVNLIGNAIKFTEHGEVGVRIVVESQDASSVVLRFSVADTGIGIPREHQKSIFDAFEQADGSIARRYGGTGLGLAISSRLVQLMGGRIWVESSSGEGSTFHFTSQFGVTNGDHVEEPVQPFDLHDVAVLVVDDNATNRRILTELLARWGARAVAAEDGRSALLAMERAAAAGDGFALVLSDGHMPGMDGFELAEAIRNHPGLPGAAILMLTSDSLLGDKARCREAGVNAYLIKPVQPAELGEAIQRALGKRNAKPDREMVARGTTAPAARQLRILLAEDNRVNQKLAVTLLSKVGHEVVVAFNGYEALAALSVGGFDLVLMDLHMPGLDGFQTAARLRAMEAATGEHIPIVAMTASAMKGDRELCMSAGMDGYISKPVRFQELLAEIDRVREKCSTLSL